MMRMQQKSSIRDQMKNCLECGYPVPGKRTGRCPECGKPIPVDIDLSLPLERSPRRIIFSFATRMTAIGILILLVIPIAMASFGRYPDGSSAFALVISVPLIVSSFLITPRWQDPVAISNGFGSRDTIRLATRWGSFSWLILASGSSLIASGLLPGTIIGPALEFLWGLVCLLCLFQVFLLFACLDRLGHWMRDEAACSMIRFIHLSLIVIGIGVLVGIIGPILFPISPGFFPIYSVIVFVVMMLVVVVLLILMTKTVWFTLLHRAENSASDRRLRDRFDETRSFVDESNTRL